MTNWTCSVGDLVSVDWYSSDGGGWKWVGICTWTDGYKYSFLVSELVNDEGLGDTITWSSADLGIVGAEVLG